MIDTHFQYSYIWCDFVSPKELQRRSFYTLNSTFLIPSLHITGKQEEVDATIETLKVVQGPFSHWARVMVDVCAYAGK